jgi:hypothetical protein
MVRKGKANGKTKTKRKDEDEKKKKKKKVAWGEGCAANVLTPSSPSSKKH